jgi:membrane-bound lytic murein transglycosylase D
MDDDRPSLSRDDDEHDAPSIDRDADGPRRLFGHRSRKRRELLVYRVVPGDTITAVAKQFGIDAEDVARANKLDVNDKLKVGALLKLKVRRDVVDELAGDKAKDDKGEDKAKRHAEKLPHHTRKGR